MFMAIFCIHRLRAVSLFSWCIEQNARDTQTITRVTEGARRERHEKREAVVSFFFSVLASRQPRPQGFSLKKWVGPHPFFEGKALGTRLARGENREEKGDNSFSFFVPLPSRAFSHARDRLRVSRVLLDAPRKKRDCS